MSGDLYLTCATTHVHNKFYLLASFVLCIWQLLFLWQFIYKLMSLILTFLLLICITFCICDNLCIWLFVAINVYNIFCLCGTIFVIIYKYFYDNFYHICVATYILYVWQLMCMKSSVFVAIYCITYSNLLPLQNIIKIYASEILFWPSHHVEHNSAISI